jgi:hypothetical protein
MRQLTVHISETPDLDSNTDYSETFPRVRLRLLPQNGLYFSASQFIIILSFVPRYFIQVLMRL